MRQPAVNRLGDRHVFEENIGCKLDSMTICCIYASRFLCLIAL